MRLRKDRADIFDTGVGDIFCPMGYVTSTDDMYNCIFRNNLWTKATIGENCVFFTHVAVYPEDNPWERQSLGKNLYIGTSMHHLPDKDKDEDEYSATHMELEDFGADIEMQKQIREREVDINIYSK